MLSPVTSLQSISKPSTAAKDRSSQALGRPATFVLHQPWGTLSPRQRKAHSDVLLDQVACLLQSGKYHDLVIKCGGRSWPVHKAIVCSASAVLDKERKSNMKEGLTSIIAHSEFDADAMARMLAFIYKGRYPVEGEEALPTESTKKDWRQANINRMLIAHVNVYGIADYYDIPMLKNSAVERFKEVAAYGIDFSGFNDVITAVWERTSVGEKCCARLCASTLPVTMPRWRRTQAL